MVHLNQQSDNHKDNTQYLGKYLKRPPIGETRIKAYDGKGVTYQYLDHYTKETHTMTPAQWNTLAHCLQASGTEPTQEKNLHPMVKDALGAVSLQSINLPTLRKGCD